MRHPVFLAWLFAVAACCLDAPNVDAGDDGKLRVATFLADVTPPLGSPTYGGKPLETVETPLLAKGIILDDGRQRYVLCAIDWCGLCGPAHMLFRDKIAAGAETDVSNVAVHTVHQHTAPYIPIGSLKIRDKAGNPPKGVDPPVVHQIADRLGEAVKSALDQFQQFDSIGTGQAKVDRVASARRILTSDGKIRTRWSACTDPELRAEPEGYIDPMLKTVTLAQGDKPLVRIHYYATHPQSYYGDARVCYDVPGFARQRLEAKEKVLDKCVKRRTTIRGDSQAGDPRIARTRIGRCGGRIRDFAFCGRLMAKGQASFPPDRHELAPGSRVARRGGGVARPLCFANDVLAFAFADGVVLPQQGNEFSYQRGTNDVIAPQRTVRMAGDQVRFS